MMRCRSVLTWRALGGPVALLVAVVALGALPARPAGALPPAPWKVLQPEGRAANAEVPTIVATNYPIPAGAYFVSLAGRDTNPGTQAAPFRTVTRAVAAAAPGSTIVMRAGTYREQVPGFSKKLTFQPYPYEKVWMKGSLVTTGWVADGPRWRLNNWTTEFCRTCIDNRAVSPGYSMARWPDMVFVNGRPLRQVDTLTKVVGDTFYVNYVANTIHIGVTPVGRLVEASRFTMALNAFTTSAGTVIRGLGFAQYAPYLNATQNAMVRVNAKNFTIENNTFAFSANGGLSLYDSEDTTVRGNTFLYNGASGVGGFRAHRLTLAGNRIAYSNQERLAAGWAVAGTKLATVRGATIADNVIEGTRAKAFWCDMSCYDFKIVRNLLRDNEQHGLQYELSSKAIVAGNVIVGHPTYGIRLDGANDVKIYNNTLARNWVNVSLTDNSWNNRLASEIALGITWITGDVVAYNNIFSDTAGSGNSLVTARDLTTAMLFKPASTMLAAGDNNAYYRANPARPGVLVEWWQSPVAPAAYATLAAFRAATGREANGVAVDGGANPFFVNAAANDYRLRAGSPASGSGRPLPADVAAAVGSPAGVAVNLGAFLPPP